MVLKSASRAPLQNVTTINVGRNRQKNNSSTTTRPLTKKKQTSENLLEKRVDCKSLPRANSVPIGRYQPASPAPSASSTATTTSTTTTTATHPGSAAPPLVVATAAGNLQSKEAIPCSIHQHYTPTVPTKGAPSEPGTPVPPSSNGNYSNLCTLNAGQVTAHLHARREKARASTELFILRQAYESIFNQTRRERHIKKRLTEALNNLLDLNKVLVTSHDRLDANLTPLLEHYSSFRTKLTSLQEDTRITATGDEEKTLLEDKDLLNPSPFSPLPGAYINE